MCNDKKSLQLACKLRRVAYLHLVKLHSIAENLHKNSPPDASMKMKKSLEARSWKTRSKSKAEEENFIDFCHHRRTKGKAWEGKSRKEVSHVLGAFRFTTVTSFNVRLWKTMLWFSFTCERFTPLGFILFGDYCWAVQCDDEMNHSFSTAKVILNNQKTLVASAVSRNGSLK